MASPKTFYGIASKLLPWVWLITLLAFITGAYTGLYLAPPDYQQGDAYRIIFIHVPCAALSLGIFTFMALNSLIYLVWHIKLADIMAACSARLGAAFTLLALITGSIWGKPMWGTFWIWDARLTSELILLFLYVGIIALRGAIPKPEKAAKASAILTLVGMLDIPIIHYSVYWWNTLHQGSTVLKFAKPSIAPSMLYPLLAMLLAFSAYFIAMVLMMARNEVLFREQQAVWIKEVVD